MRVCAWWLAYHCRRSATHSTLPMNRNIQALVGIAQKPTRHIVGLMSGTSMDGLDVALCAISGAGETTRVKLLQFQTVDYTDDIKAQIRQVFAQQTINFQHLALLNGWIGQLHASMVLGCLRQWGVASADVDLIASHGQTVMHAPKLLHQQAMFSNATLQIGDGDHVAVGTGVVTVSDFRQKHVAAGGEGAPLAVYGDYLLFSSPQQNRLMLNMGGIANFTYLPASQNAEEVFVTDTGTGNTLLDAYTRECYPHLAYDKDAHIARQGQVHAGLLAALQDHPFFAQPFPKTTGPELFNLGYLQAAQARSGTTTLAVPDVMATLVRFSAVTIAQAVLACVAQAGLPIDSFHVYLSGGGMHNPLLVANLQTLLPCPFLKTNDLGISGDAKEAVLFAILANETVCGGTSDFGQRRGIPSVTMGKISFPW
jgi:anhydro-N-acetylmuramic acid kinase